MSIDKTRVYESGFASAVGAVVGLKRAIDLVEFDMEKVVAAWAEGVCVMLVSLDVIHQRLNNKLKELGKCA